MRIKRIEGYVLFPATIMFGISFTGESVEVFLGLVALSIQFG